MILTTDCKRLADGMAVTRERNGLAIYWNGRLCEGDDLVLVPTDPGTFVQEASRRARVQGSRRTIDVAIAGGNQISGQLSCISSRVGGSTAGGVIE
jgi:hypothetical protein